MNRLFHFSTGAFSTCMINYSLLATGFQEVLATQLVSLVGGVVSALLIAWLRRRWQGKDHGSDMA